jgi:hydrogenase maturation protease
LILDDPLTKIKNDIVVIGLGNTLMADEGIGCAVVAHFIDRQQEYPGVEHIAAVPAAAKQWEYHGVEFIDGGTGGMKLLHIISGRKKVIIIDCAAMGTEPGTIKRFSPEQAKSVKQLSHYSLHEADVLQIIEMSRKLGECPETIVIFGIEPKSVEHGRELSEALSRRLSEYIETIEKELNA